MYKITGIKNKDKQGKRVNIFVDGRLGLTLNAETAILEAKRCIQCKKRNCTAGCPVEVFLITY